MSSRHLLVRATHTLPALGCAAAAAAVLFHGLFSFLSPGVSGAAGLVC